MADIKTNTINLLNNQNYDYGTLLNEAVAEQNQTYFAYFDNVIPTRPTIINQTAYQIKYLIDTEGNPVNPEPDTVANRPQAIALYNLKNNFEPGDSAIIKLIENDPLYVYNPYNDALVGKYPITHVGRIIPLATTEYGQLDTEYIPTMSFQNYDLYVQGNYPDFSFTAYPSTGISYINEADGYGIVSGGGGPQEFFNFDIIETNELGYYDETTSTYTFGQNTADYGLAVSFELSTEINAYFEYHDANMEVSFNCFIEYSTDNGVTWDIIDVAPFDNTYGSLPSLIPYINQGTIQNFMNSSTNTGLGYRLTLRSIDFQPDVLEYLTISSTPNFYNSLRSVPQSFQTGDQVRCRWFGSYSYNGLYSSAFATSSLNILSLPSTSTRFQLISNVGYINTTTSSYFDSISSPPTSSLPYQFQYLTASLGFSRFIDNNYVQVFDPSSLSFNYLQSTYPLNISPGDKIRCEYNPYQVSTIIEVTQVDESPISRKCLVIFPPIIPNGATLDHFTIYRVVDDGSSIILNVPPPQPGTVFSGIIQPEFVSQELVNNYDKIIVNLTEREIIN